VADLQELITRRNEFAAGDIGLEDAAVGSHGLD
jgi:hypothetical protein